MTHAQPDPKKQVVAQSEGLEREIRFAVVIYGGVSLAVYINGIVQELLHMVRSTKVENIAELSPVERVYRVLASTVGAPPYPAVATAAHQYKPLGDRPGKAGLRAVTRAAVRAQLRGSGVAGQPFLRSRASDHSCAS